ncbi:MAG: Gfo/Idh/MocA family protein [Lautropia sp.]
MTIRLGFIGFGIMGERLLRAARAHDPSVVVVSGIHDPAPLAAARLHAIDPALPVFASADALIAASDCLHIASPPRSHLGYLAQCAAAGRAALCEKPLATDVAAARSAVQALNRQRMRAGVNFPFASSFAVEQLRRWIDEGRVGTPTRLDIEIGFATWPRRWQADAASWLDGPAEGGFTREVGSHLLFLSQRLLGPLALTSARTLAPADGRSERRIDARFAAGGVPATLSGAVGTTTKDDHHTWTLSGSEGRIRLRDWSFAEREVDGRWLAAPDAIPNEQARPLVLARQLDKLAAMTRGEPTTLASLDEALAVQVIVESILAARD